MGRTVEDTALLLDAMTGDSPGDPISLPRTESFLAAARSGWRPARVAFSTDLGITPVDPEVASICRAAATVHRDGYHRRGGASRPLRSP